MGSTGASAHDLLRMAQRGRMLDWAGESRYYVEPKRLAKLGYLDSRREPGRTRERTVYSLTDKGLESLRDYASTPVRFQPFKSDLLLRLLLADLVGEAAVRESAGTMRAELAELLMQVCLFLRDLLDLHLDWIDDIERKLSADAEAQRP